MVNIGFYPHAIAATSSLELRLLTCLLDDLLDATSCELVSSAPACERASREGERGK